jgi:hypothetical protein
MDIRSVALAAGLAWGSGIRLYAVLFLAGLMARLGYVELPPGLGGLLPKIWRGLRVVWRRLQAVPSRQRT